MDDIAKYSPRIQYLYHRYVPELIRLAVERGNVTDYEMINETVRKVLFPALLMVDPTPNKSATQWIIVTFLNRGFLYEDLGKVHETLVEFLRYQHRLPVEKRSFTHYKTLADMWNAIAPMVEARLIGDEQSPEGRAKRKADREKAYLESFFIQEGQETTPTIVSPQTEFASCWWGRGTRWCTASKEYNMFDSYSDAPRPEERGFSLKS